jgi:SAM-dependent methyltransferase
MRAIIHVLSTVLFDKSLALHDFPVRSDIRVMGLSDWDGYAIPLAGKLAYTNTFYHQEPKLDITSIDSSLAESLDVLISSDVFEHVAPPISTAFENSFRLLKPGGILILTVPYSLEPDTREHFPELHRYEIRRNTGRAVLYNLTQDGREQVFDKLNFHGGAGETLEMRLFSLEGIKRDLKNAGFQKITLFDEPNFIYGVYFKNPWSLPIVARKS